MHPSHSASVQSAKEYDPYLATSASPTLRPGLELTGGVSAFGMRMHCAKKDRAGQELYAPAFVENLLAIQLHHRFSYRMQYKGTCVADVVPGDIALTPRGTPVHWRVTDGEMNALVLALPAELLRRTVERDLNGSACSVELTMQTQQHDPLLHAVGLKMYGLLGAENTLDALYLDSLITLLAVHIIRAYSVFVPKLPRDEAGLPAALLKRVIDYIDANLDTGLSLEKLGEMSQYSPYHLARLFKASTGYTLHQYVVDRRLTRAAELIQHSTLSLQAIAQQVGFTDQSHLTHQFRRKYGYPPGVLRKRMDSE